MACPYFIPTEKFAEGKWLHPTRLPLGAGWRGLCTAGCYQQIVPSDEELHRFCNLGYATGCQRLPAQRRSDAVRFSIARDREDRIEMCYVFESAYRPGGHGVLEYDAVAGCWAVAHPDPRVQTMAACYLQSYLERRQSGQTRCARSGQAPSKA